MNNEFEKTKNWLEGFISVNLPNNKLRMQLIDFVYSLIYYWKQMNGKILMLLDLRFLQ